MREPSDYFSNRKLAQSCQINKRFLLSSSHRHYYPSDFHAVTTKQ